MTYEEQSQFIKDTLKQIHAVMRDLRKPENYDLLIAFVDVKDQITELSDENHYERLSTIVQAHNGLQTNVGYWETLWGAYRRLKWPERYKEESEQ